jgi:c-di-GMP-binding flagellar brake protein YcgR
VLLHDDSRDSPVKTRTIDVSDGGVYLTAPTSQASEPGKQVALKLLVPRSTPNTYMLEEVNAQATVIRHDALKDNSRVGVAMRFMSPQQLNLEV